jgi:hypothetical protein
MVMGRSQRGAGIMEEEYRGSSMPKVDLYGANIDIQTITPLFGVSRDEEPEYLEYDIKGRSAIERLFLYSGTSYLTGIYDIDGRQILLGGFDSKSYVPPQGSFWEGRWERVQGGRPRQGHSSGSS